MARITLEDLEQFENEPMEDASGQEQVQEAAAQNQLFSHWEAVASTHHVSLPRDMAAPILEMTSHRDLREPIPYVPLSRDEKSGETAYEERLYPAGKWVCVRKREPKYEQSIALAFMKLMRYICRENSAGRYLGMTVPVLNRIQMTEEEDGFVGEISTELYLPAEFQHDPPIPEDPDILIIGRESFQVISRVFFGPTTEETIGREIGMLWELIGDTDTFIRGTYMVAAYENPSVPHRRNEIWFIRRVGGLLPP